MKYYINKIIVVEGKEDVSYLSSFIESEYVTTNGYDIPKEEIEYLNEASKHKGILVLVDPDEAGRNIQNRLSKLLPQAIFIEVDITKCIRGKKDGVAECLQEEIIRVLEKYFENKNPVKTPQNITKLDLNDGNFKKYICDRFHLGRCNSKKILTRLSTLEISEEDIKKAKKDYYGN